MRKFRYFFDFVEGQEKWLNKMAERGYRLTGVNKLFYEFEKCNPLEYQYYVEFVGDKSCSQIKEYKSFLEDLGVVAYTKNININYSFGKVRLRPWAKLSGQIVTSPGGYNKELLILEKKKDGNKFKVHTDLNSLIKYYYPIRNMYLFTSVLLFLLIILNQSIISTLSKVGIGFTGTITVVLLILAIKYSKIINDYKKRSKIYQ